MATTQLVGVIQRRIHQTEASIIVGWLYLKRLLDRKTLLIHFVLVRISVKERRPL